MLNKNKEIFNYGCTPMDERVLFTCQKCGFAERWEIYPSALKVFLSASCENCKTEHFINADETKEPFNL